PFSQLLNSVIDCAAAASKVSVPVTSISPNGTLFAESVLSAVYLRPRLPTIRTVQLMSVPAITVVPGTPPNGSMYSFDSQPSKKSGVRLTRPAVSPPPSTLRLVPNRSTLTTLSPNTEPANSI